MPASRTQEWQGCGLAYASTNALSVPAIMQGISQEDSMDISEAEQYTSHKIADAIRKELEMAEQSVYAALDGLIKEVSKLREVPIGGVLQGSGKSNLHKATLRAIEVIDRAVKEGRYIPDVVPTSDD